MGFGVRSTWVSTAYVRVSKLTSISLHFPTCKNRNTGNNSNNTLTQSWRQREYILYIYYIYIYINHTVNTKKLFAISYYSNLAVFSNY